MIWYLAINFGIMLTVVLLALIVRWENVMSAERYNGIIHNFDDSDLKTWIIMTLAIVFLPISVVLLFSIIVLESIYCKVVHNYKEVLSKEAIDELVKLGYRGKATHAVPYNDQKFQFSFKLLREVDITDGHQMYEYYYTISCKACRKWLFDNYGVSIKIKYEKEKYNFTARYLGSNHEFSGDSVTLNDVYKQIIKKL